MSQTHSQTHNLTKSREERIGAIFGERPSRISAMVEHIRTLTGDAEKLNFLAEYCASDREALEILYDWRIWGRPKQLVPAPTISGRGWRYWLMLAGRGWGKTQAGCQQIRAWAEGGKVRHMAMVGATAADIRDVMVLGPSGLLNSCPPWNRPRYQEGHRRVTWTNPDYPSYGATCMLFSAEEPERLRGPQHEKAWADEACAWRYCQDAWDMLMLGLRLGREPQCVITTTPKPIEWLVHPETGMLSHPSCAITVGSTYENVDNLSADYFNDIIRKYEGSRLGNQELLAQVLTDIPGALWNRTNIDHNRVSLRNLKSLPTFLNTVVAVDPAVTAKSGSAETGICVAAYGDNDHFYILHMESLKAHPDQWAQRVVDLYEEFECMSIVAETNNGGDLVESVIRHVRAFAPVVQVKAARGKVTRAEPVALLYEKNRVHHVGTWAEGESQMVSFNPLENPEGLKDMVDALVWAMWKLMEDASPYSDYYRPRTKGEREGLKRYGSLHRFA